MTSIPSFALERYFDKHEFSARYLLSCSDCEPMAMADLLAMADEDSRRQWNDLILSYTQTSGHPMLRETIASMYQGLEMADILVMAPEEGIYLFMETLLNPGDHVVCTFPGYQSLYELARAKGCEVTLWALEEADGWRPDLNKLEAMIRDTTKLVVINFPHNPTGFLPSREEYDALIELVRRKGAYLFSDEMYRYLEVDLAMRLPAACECYDKAVTLGGLSKAFGLPGLRLGWLATRDRDLLPGVKRLKDYTTICNSAPGEILALMALRSRETIVDRQRSRLRLNLAALDGFMQTHDNAFAWNPPVAGSVCFPRLRISDDAHRFCDGLVKSAGIMLVPSSMFDYGHHHVRIGYGRENFCAVLKRFADFLDK